MLNIVGPDHGTSTLSVIPPIAMESKEEDTGQWGRSVDVGSRAPPASPDSGLFLGGQAE